MFDRNLFLHHFSQEKNNLHERIVVDYQGFRWGYIREQNAYENLNSGQVIPASLFEDMQNQQSDTTSQSSTSDDGGFGYSERSKNIAIDIRKILKRRGSREFERTATGFNLFTTNRLVITDVSLSDRYIDRDGGSISCSFEVRGGRRPYLIKRQWYVNDTPVGGNADYFTPSTYNHNDKFYVIVTVDDELGNKATAKSETGIIMQPISFTSFTISPERVNVGGTVTYSIGGLTGSFYHIQDVDTGIYLYDYYLYVGRDISAGFTRAGPQPSGTYDLSLYDIIGGSITAGTTLGGSVIIQNNLGSTQIANTDNTATVIDPNAPVDYDTYAVAITERYRPTTSYGTSGFDFEAIPSPTSSVNDMTQGRWSGDQWEPRTDTSTGNDAGFAAAIPYVAGWAYNDETWHIMPYVSGSYGSVADGRVKFDYTEDATSGGRTGETFATGSTAAFTTAKTTQDWRFFFLSDYTPGAGASWSRYQDT